MELKDAKINFLGDSITEGHGTSGKDYTFWSIIGRETGATVRGYGIGGTRIARQIRPNPDQHYDYEDYCLRCETMDADADAIVVFGGTNDYGHGDAPLGHMTDRTEETFFGAMHILCQKLMNRYPAADIVFLTPLHRLDEEALFNERGIRNVGTLEDYCRAEKEVCAYYGIPVMDMRRQSQFQPAIPSNRERYMPDGLHPNDCGHIRMAHLLTEFLKQL